MSERRKNAAARLYDECHERLHALQASCPHTELTDWIEEWWAIGHSTGRKVRCCAECNKVIHVQRHCHRCSTVLIDDQAKEGDGNRLPAAAYYCARCYAQG